MLVESDNLERLRCSTASSSARCSSRASSRLKLRCGRLPPRHGGAEVTPPTPLGSLRTEQVSAPSDLLGRVAIAPFLASTRRKRTARCAAQLHGRAFTPRQSTTCRHRCSLRAVVAAMSRSSDLLLLIFFMPTLQSRKSCADFPGRVMERPAMVQHPLSRQPRGEGHIRRRDGSPGWSASMLDRKSRSPQVRPPLSVMARYRQRSGRVRCGSTSGVADAPLPALKRRPIRVVGQSALALPVVLRCARPRNRRRARRTVGETRVPVLAAGLLPPSDSSASSRRQRNITSASSSALNTKTIEQKSFAKSHERLHGRPRY